jgi:hypothetical protein
MQWPGHAKGGVPGICSILRAAVRVELANGSVAHGRGSLAGGCEPQPADCCVIATR